MSITPKGPISEPMGPAAEAVIDVRITLATGGVDGVLAFASCRYARLRIDGLTVRRAPGGGITVGFPARKDGRGRRHYFVAPEDAATRAAIETAVLAAWREAAP